MTSWKYVIWGIILILPIIGYGGILVYKDIRFNIDIGGHMKRAADANTVELATQEMQIVVKNMEQAEMTSGYTSVIYRTPDEDVGFWYTNMKNSLKELQEVKPDTSQLEKSNVLMKLRETLLDNTREGGTGITVPPGISRFPNNAIYAILFWVFLIIAIAGVISIIYGVESRY